MLSTRDRPQNKKFTQVEREEMENKHLMQMKTKKEKPRVAILISDKIDF